jgi:hypothetical protein
VRKIGHSLEKRRRDVDGRDGLERSQERRVRRPRSRTSRDQKNSKCHRALLADLEEAAFEKPSWAGASTMASAAAGPSTIATTTARFSATTGEDWTRSSWS